LKKYTTLLKKSLLSYVSLIFQRLQSGDSISVGRDAKLAFQKAAGIFIMYLTYCATDFCKQHHRSTISANDVFDALNELEFDEYVEPLKECEFDSFSLVCCSLLFPCVLTVSAIKSFFSFPFL